MLSVNSNKWVRRKGHEDTICPALHNGRLQGRVSVCVGERGVRLGSAAELP